MEISKVPTPQLKALNMHNTHNQIMYIDIEMEMLTVIKMDDIYI